MAGPTKAQLLARLDVVEAARERVEAELAMAKAEVATQATEALETATSEILRVISRSPADVRPIFDAIVEKATRLCDATWGAAFRFDGQLQTFAAGYNVTARELAVLQREFPRPLTRDRATGRAIADRRVVHIADIQRDPEYAGAPLRAVGFRSVLAVPMLRAGESIGVLGLWCQEVRPFTEKQIHLVETFAAQAVIAIENVRLSTELQQKNEALTQAHAQVSEALEQQTATAEILRVISSSPTDIQPVFDTIVKSVARLCDGMFAALHRFDGELLHWVAQHNYTPEGLEAMRRTYPMRASRDTVSGRAVIDRTVIHIRDFERDPDAPASSRDIARAFGYRSLVTVPMLREGQPVGAIAVARRDGPFSAGQIDLLQTFAAQAVIAIENVRLFTELQASNRELTTALDTQTATADILRVISRSQTDVQPVFDAILASAVRLLRTGGGVLTRKVGDQIELGALVSDEDAAAEAALRTVFPLGLQSAGIHAAAIRTRVPLNIPDAETDPRLGESGRTHARVRGYQSLAVVPLLRQDEAVGTIAVSRTEPGGFTDDEIGLLQTFADQAVIAIENVRLFTELQEKNQALTQAHAQVSASLEQQTATSEILQVISRSPTDVQPVLDAIARRAVELCGAYFANVFLVEADLVHWRASHNVPPEGADWMRNTYPLATSADEIIPAILRERRAVALEDTLRAQDGEPKSLWP